MAFNPDHSQNWGTYFDGTEGIQTVNSQGNGVALFGDSKLYLTGISHAFGTWDKFATAGGSNWPWWCGTTTPDWCQIDGDGFGEAFITQFDLTPVTGVEEMEYNIALDNLLVYPNPTNDVINIKFKLNQSGDVSIKVYNIMGGLVYSNFFINTSSNFHQELNFSSLSKGMYLVNVQVDERSYSRKILYQ